MRSCMLISSLSSPLVCAHCSTTVCFLNSSSCDHLIHTWPHLPACFSEVMLNPTCVSPPLSVESPNLWISTFKTFQFIKSITEMNAWSVTEISTIRDIFTPIKNLGIELMLGQKYGDFLRNPQISYPELNWRIFTLIYLREIKLNF